MTSASDLGGVGPIVLAIDDDATTLGLITTQMAGLPFRVFTERSPLKAIGTAATLNPDVVLLDVNMPEMNGIEFLRERSKDPALAKVPVIVLTTQDEEALKAEALGLGANSFLVKPFQKEVLVQTLASVAHS